MGHRTTLTLLPVFLVAAAAQNETPAAVRYIFKGNASFPYNKGAMLQQLPGGRLIAACQAGRTEAASDQRILYAISEDDGGYSWPEFWTALAPEANPDEGPETRPSPTDAKPPNQSI